MSAGGLSYSGLTNHGKITLPSVESWSTNFNILKDPPRGIHTRRIDKVGETSEITTMIDESGSRISGINDSILVYARGVNPMVAVSYDNYGNNSGAKKGNRASAGMTYGQNHGNTNASLPYKVMNKGAFRPPIRDQRDLLPLSRLPRVWTSSFSQPGFTDFSKKAMCPTPDFDTETKGVRTANEMLRPCSHPTTSYQLEAPVVEPFEVRYVIKNPLNVSVTSGLHTQARFNGKLGDPVKEINPTPLKPAVHLNKGGNEKRTGENTYDTSKYTHDVLQGDFSSNKSRNVQTTRIDELFSTDRATKNRTNVSYTTPHTSYNKYEEIHGEKEMRRNGPQYQAYTNPGRNIHKRSENQIEEREYTPNRPVTQATTNFRGVGFSEENMNREYQLKPTIRPGSFETSPSLPIVYQDNMLMEFDQNKVEMRQRIYDMQQDRNVQQGNIPYSPVMVG